jgi:hypothetical protein
VEDEDDDDDEDDDEGDSNTLLEFVFIVDCKFINSCCC